LTERVTTQAAGISVPGPCHYAALRWVGLPSRISSMIFAPESTPPGFRDTIIDYLGILGHSYLPRISPILRS
jgi:hypothetical protein